MKQPKRLFLATSILALASTATNVSAATDPAKAKVFDDVIVPVLSAKCYDCHGADKDKGKLRLHTKEALLKGGKDAGAKIIVKGKLDDSELYYRIALPNDDDDVMPPFDEDEPHNPVTPQEQKVFAAWILAGASFDAKVSDLEGDARKAASKAAASGCASGNSKRRDTPTDASDTGAYATARPASSCRLSESQRVSVLLPFSWGTT